MMRSVVVRMVVILWGIALWGCGVDVGEISPQSTVRVPRDGRLYILNNLRPQWTRPREFFITYEGQRFDPPHNLTIDGEPTLAGAMLLTPEPLPGGTQVDFPYSIEQVGNINERILSDFLGGPVIIDGDITIEFYNYKWDTVDSVPVPKVIPGKFDGAHVY